MDVIVAIGAERNQILVCVITQSAPRANVVDLKMIGAATGLAPPAVAQQHFGAEFAIRILVQPQP
jgi:hypothetical protein